MGLLDWFRGKQHGGGVTPYDPKLEEPVLRIGICTGEKVAGFRDLKTGKFREAMLITCDDDLKDYCRLYAVQPGSIKNITAG